MKDNDYVMYIIMEYEKERKEKEALKKVMKNKKSNVDIEGEKGKDQSISVEKKNIDKEQKRDTNEKAAKQEATIDNIKDNVGIHLSCGPKLGLEPIDELVNEVIETSDKKDDVIQEKLQKEPVSIVDRDIRKLRKKEIRLVKVQWKHQLIQQATWEIERNMQDKYPHLFEDTDDKQAKNERKDKTQVLHSGASLD
ncbi:uncharacterized protein LOC107874890 [Capsicum annuum]|uniref:uncharacterized protein LOC107874890 n=1 Tax=Capsicum annuum TaxID=4072 RepID=UPI0007BF848E|nr:uncharacterized protein LOC107874890 [Capsicum annuum]